jgi:8-oxo-dGTP pyrophosphatase MutT (NUDIX family)
VLLVRDHPTPPPGRTPLQVFLQRRAAGMAFAGGMTVFPGGGVDHADRPDATHWAGPDPSWWGERFGCDAELAGALVSAAVRETFEECGVLLAGPHLPEGTARLRPEATARLRAEATVRLRPEGTARLRADLVARRRTLADVLDQEGLVLGSDLLRPWSRWITPETSPRRYDTAFFVARVPEGQEADAHTTEAVEATWWHPAEALESWERGDVQLLAPTHRSLQEIAEHADAASVLAAADERVIRPILPIVRRAGEQVTVMLPGEPGFELAGEAPGSST